jgi:acetyl esterase/lipase
MSWQTRLRPSWTAQFEIFLHLLRQQFEWDRHKISFVRTTHDRASILNSNYTHPNTRIERVEISTNRDALLEYEKEAGKFPSKENAEFPIPEEHDYASRYQMKGEWLHPSESCASTPSRTVKIIFYVHGGAYCFGSTELYRPFIGNLCAKIGLSIFSINYRLVNLYYTNQPFLGSRVAISLGTA